MLFASPLYYIYASGTFSLSQTTGDMVMIEGLNLHVVPSGDGWAIKEEGEPEALASYPVQRDAILAATDHLNNRDGGGEVFVHGTDGRIRERNTINRRDPFPPRG